MNIIRISSFSVRFVAVPALLAVSAACAAAGNESTLVVSASSDGLSELDTPAAVSVVDGDDLRLAAPRVNLSENLSGLPGVQIQNRQNYAQDLQISIRGFGSRSTYGVRGMRIYVDGIPATMPDGQGQTSNIDLNSVDRVEVLRGPFSALYGNASGGVINIASQKGSQPASVEASSYYGSFGSWRYGLKAQGATGDGSQAGDVDYAVSATRFSTHGYRDHSSAQKNLGNARLGVRINDVSTLTLLFNSVDINAQDAGGLTNAEWHANPRQSPRAEQYNTRKTTKQTQAGLRYERQMSENDDLSLMAWAGERETVQYQSIPRAPQRKATHAGGVIDLTRHYQGIDARWTHRDAIGAVPVTLTGGLDYETMSERRKGFENFVLQNNTPSYGHKGDLRRNERNLMWNLDPYLQTSWQLTPKLTLDAGVRFSTVNFDDNDFYTRRGSNSVTDPDNGDDSGEARYHRWLPAAALKYALTDAWNIYASAGRGFESPTITELSYRNDDQGGLNNRLQPSTSDTLEIGSKTRIGNGLLSAALFQTDTKSEIVVANSEGRRSSYKNAGQTRRRGLELALDQQFALDWRLRASWTLLDATYRDSVESEKNPVTRGNRLPGVARNMAFAALEYAPEAGWYGGIDLRYISEIQTNDSNSEQAPAYAVTALNGGYKWRTGNWVLDLFGRVDNLFDRSYVGSVIVNEGNGRYFEPAPGRNYGVGASLSWEFD
ncbi:iron complex outermembrane receptor protein [Pantoea alhagi]|uniref:TonB-dependent receptor PqqU n=1 Tax=Mixta sp. BE291 TaxID=3158787 RepID=UPI00285FAF1D|nr:iron complex outermembrane receptor protein [Pantoea alhagi]